MIKNKKLYLLCIFLITISTQIFAGEVENIKIKIANYEKTLKWESNEEDNIKLYNAWDKELNIIYDKLIKELKNKNLIESSEKLKIAQREWINFRDEEANFSDVMTTQIGYGREPRNVLNIQLLRDLTIERTYELANIYNSIISKKTIIRNNSTRSTFREKDAKLNKSYKNVIGELKRLKFTEENLVNSQKIWILYRNKNADFYSSLVKTNTEGAILTSIIFITDQRTKQLDAIYNDYLKGQ